MSLILTSCLPLHPIILLPLLLFLPSIFLLWKRNHEQRKFPPGPRPFPIIGNIHQVFGGLPHRTLWQLSQQYGPLMYLKLGSKPAIVVSSSKLADDVLRKQDLDFCNRPPYPSYRRLSYNYLDMAFTPFGDHYRERRKVLNNELLSLNRVQSFGFIREEEVARMIASLSHCVWSSTPANLTELMFALTSTIASRAAFGKSYVEGNEKNVYVRSFQGLQAAFGAFFFEYYMPWLGWMDVLTGERQKLEKAFREADAFYEQVIEDHLNPKREKQGREDFVDNLLGIVKDQGLSREHIKGLLLVSSSSFVFCVSFFNQRRSGCCRLE